MTETELRKQILEMIRDEFPRVQVTKHQSGTVLKRGGGRVHLGPAGWPDIMGYLPDGKFLAIEVKLPGAKKQRQHEQDERAAHIQATPAVYMRVVSVEEVRFELTQRGYAR